MPKPFSQDLRNRVIDAVRKGGMSCRAAARRYEVSELTAIKWLERYRRDGLRGPVGHGGHRPSALMPHREFLEAARAEKSDLTLQKLCDRLRSEKGVKADTSMMSRFFRRIGVTNEERVDLPVECARHGGAPQYRTKPTTGSPNPEAPPNEVKNFARLQKFREKEK